MEIRDPLHGQILINSLEAQLIAHPFFKRLRRIRQLGFSESTFPGATHSRYLHSLGTKYIAEKAFMSVFPGDHSSDFLRLKQTLIFACLLHDIGHAPFSHVTEVAMPSLQTLKLPSWITSTENKDQRASHEHYTVKIILDSSFREVFKLPQETLGITPESVASLIMGTCHDSAYFSVAGKNYFPILHQLVSSEIDCDRMDYLLRDSFFCGVNYGKFDLDWILTNLTTYENKNQEVFLALNTRGLLAFDNYLMSRYHMFLMVYLHYRPVCLEKMFKLFLEQTPEYRIPADIEAFAHQDDFTLHTLMQESYNPWAQKIIHNEIPQDFIENVATQESEMILEIQKFFDRENIFYLLDSSRSKISKYYKNSALKHNLKIKVKEKKALQTYVFDDLEVRSTIYQKYAQPQIIQRLYFNSSALSKKQMHTLRQFC